MKYQNIPKKFFENSYILMKFSVEKYFVFTYFLHEKCKQDYLVNQIWDIANNASNSHKKISWKYTAHIL